MHLILLPGLDGTGRLFAPLVSHFPPGVKTAVVAYPLHEKKSYHELCDLVTAILPPDEPYAILAESFSGPIAVRIAATSPQNLRAVILCATFVHVPGNFLLRAALRIFSHFMFSVNAPRWIVRYLLAGRDASDELLSLLHDAVSTVKHSVLTHRFRMVLNADDGKALQNISVPMLYLFPTKDRLLGRRGLDRILSIRPDIAVKIIEAPHCVLQREPADALQKINEWMKEEGLVL